MRLKRDLPSLILITVITLLIWLYAEAQNVKTVAQTLTVELPDRVGQDIVVYLPNDEDRLRASVQLRGSSTQISAFQNRLAGRALQLPIEPAMLPDDRNTATLDLSPLLAQARLDPTDPTSPTINSLGLNVVSSEPTQITVSYDRLVTRTIPVRFQPTDVQIAPTFSVDPPTVEVTLPQQALDLIGGSEDALYVEAVIEPDRLRAIDEGMEQTLNATLDKSNLVGVSGVRPQRIRLHQQDVDVTFTIARQRDTVVAQLVPVWVVAPPSELARFEVTLADNSRVLRDVNITGPRDLIERLRNNPAEMRVIGRFELTGEDLERGVTRVPLSSIEIQHMIGQRSEVVELVPLDTQRTTATPDGGGAVFTSPNITITTQTSHVNITVTRRPSPPLPE
jgi:hypothetical protein